MPAIRSIEDSFIVSIFEERNNRLFLSFVLRSMGIGKNYLSFRVKNLPQTERIQDGMFLDSFFSFCPKLTSNS